jgi:hypothetical protein
MGKVEEFLVDEKSLDIGGVKISGIEDAIPRENICALGPSALLLEIGQKPPLKEEKVQEEEQEPQGFESRQSAYLIGKKLTRDIILDDGTLVASKGEAITWQIIRKVKTLNRLQELINSIEA